MANLHARLTKELPPLPLEEIQKILRFEVAHFSKVYIVLDALDECPSSNGEQLRFVRMLSELLPKSTLLITSRQNVDITPIVPDVVRIDVMASDIDIRAYAADRLSGPYVELGRILDTQPQLRTEIINIVVDRASGM